MKTNTYTKGSRVETTGVGRTKSWGRYTGTVLRKMSKNSVEVKFDKANFTTDEMELSEIKPLIEE